MNIEMKVIEQDKFPDKLKIIKKLPQCLYTIGNINLLYEDSFAFVGTRNPTEYGKQICREFAKEFAFRNIPIVSGMATGIDEIAHRTALEYEAKTIAVLGCGFNYYWNLKQNEQLFLEIIKKGGLILSEYDVFVEKQKENFPQRNRIIAAISDGVLVVEAAFRSGSSITAKWAETYEKPVFAIPGRIYEKMSVGTNNLIKKGAILSTSANEIINSFPQFANRMRKTIKKTENVEKKTCINKEWKDIISILKEGTFSLEEMRIKTEKDIRILIKILSEMEIEGLIEQEIGIGYKLKSR